MRYKLRNDAFSDALKLADIIQDVAGGVTPCTQFPDAWFPEGNASGRPRHETIGLTMVNEAKKLCLTSCPVLRDCREYALKHAEPDGIWGGMTPNDRKIALNRKSTRRIVGA